MQLISAVVRPASVGPICDALQAFGYHGFTVLEASGYGKERAPTEYYRGAKYDSGFQDRTKIEIVLPDDEVSDIIEVICAAAAGEGTSDGKIWVTPVTEIVRISTREKGPAAFE